jgi:transposase
VGTVDRFQGQEAPIVFVSMCASTVGDGRKEQGEEGQGYDELQRYVLRNVGTEKDPRDGTYLPDHPQGQSRAEEIAAFALVIGALFEAGNGYGVGLVGEQVSEWRLPPHREPLEVGSQRRAVHNEAEVDDQGSNTESGCILPNMSEEQNLELSEPSRLESLYRKARDPVLRTHLLMVWRVSLGDSIGEVAERVGYSKKWTTEIVRRYESAGVDALGDRRHGNPGAKERALLDESEQEELREALEGPPPTSVGGGMWSGPKVARWIEQKRGLERVHAQRGWEYLRKVGHSPQVPRPSNAQGADSEEREAFKKSLR